MIPLLFFFSFFFLRLGSVACFSPPNCRLQIRKIPEYRNERQTELTKAKHGGRLGD